MMTRMVRPLPTGTVTFLFTDIEGSTRLLQDLGTAPYAQALAEHRRLLREAFARHSGVEMGTEGDALFAAFPTAPGALQAALESQKALEGGPLRVRMGLHTGTAHLSDGDYVGEDVHLVARITSAAHGGQVLLSSATAALVLTQGLTDLGEHRLKDFPQPVVLFQVGEERFPPLRTISNTNLPRPASSFVGRQQELREVLSLLREGTRLLTLSGPGGSGKTRLALEAASELVPEFRAGVFSVALASLQDPGLVIPTIAHTLGAKNGLAEHIGDRELLLLLDNLEQVVSAAPELAALVEACPQLRLLITSRELLRVRGEAEYPVPPLADPEAVELFCARSGLDPGETITQLCRALDDLPLAIELAAARTSVLSPAQILDRLSQRLDLLRGGRDAEARQQTLRAAIDWSHELLKPVEQTLFARLAVFRGGCTLEAAEQAAGADLDTLQSLVEKSLLRGRENRFWMLETIREYATERLRDSGEADQLRQRHAEWFLALAEEVYPHLKGTPKEWLDRLEAEHDNLRAALDRLQSSGQTQLNLQLAGALWKFWSLRGHVVEGGRRLEAALRADTSFTAARARALDGATGTAIETGDLATAEVRAQEAHELHRRLGDQWGVANSRYLLGAVFAEQGEHRKAQKIFGESVRAFRELGDDHYTLLALRALAWMHSELGDIEGYRALREEHLRLARETRNQRAVAHGLQFKASLASEGGRLEEAMLLLKEAYQMHRDTGEVREVINVLCDLAETLAGAGRAAGSALLLAKAEAQREEIGAVHEAWVVTMNEKTLAAIRTQLDDASYNEACEQGRNLPIEDAVAVALEMPR